MTDPAPGTISNSTSSSNSTSISVMIIIDKAPFLGSNAAESLDAAIALASFGQKVTLWFSQEGVFNLLKGNQANKFNQLDHCATIEGLEYFDIEQVVVTSEDWDKYQLAQTPLRLEPTLLDSAKVVDSFKHYHQILRFS